ncbi:hypothetical protein FPV67DRAFT_641495 [Lyophyllum atratum]|nr:hypothetical protein FPV67DRAFT_641495 [Lyophyllum atratum]
MMVTGLGVAVACIFRATRLVQFGATCVALKVPYDTVSFGIFTVVRHAFIWMLTIHRRNIGRYGYSSRVPVVRLMLRDGAWIFAAIGAILPTATPHFGVRPAAAQAMIPWSISLVSILTCRLILNMQRLQTRANSTAPELTTNIDFDDSESERHILASTSAPHEISRGGVEEGQAG